MFAILHIYSFICVRFEMFALEVKVEDFASNGSDGRKSLRKGCVFKWDVEFRSLTLELLLSSLSKELNLSSD